MQDSCSVSSEILDEGRATRTPGAAVKVAQHCTRVGSDGRRAGPRRRATLAAVLAVRRRPQLLALAAGAAAALSLAACGAGPREASTSTVDGLILDRGTVVGASGDRPKGTRALNAEPSKTLDQLQSSMHHQQFGDGGLTLLPYLNGLQPNAIPADKEAAKHTYPGDIAYPGDRVGWIPRDKSDVAAVPTGVVGLFPAPFTTRFTKKRRLLPVRIQCAEAQSAACDGVQQALTDLKLHTATSNLQDTSAIDEIRIYVGSWPQLRPAMQRGRMSGARVVETEAERNGYGFQISSDGKTIRAAAPFGEAAAPEVYGAGTGVIFALRDELGSPAWVVTGADDAGAGAAAKALDENDLAGRVSAIVPPR